ncbi:VOC family protein [Paenibacillus sp. FSL P2-0089]|uniref:VOC family protein n=1 Tax=Paenibacillus sp. FSL P2-0089 TaxID=2954526 RepID=UPI003159BA1F
MIVPAIHLPGNCKEAIEFYQQVFDVTDVCIDYFRNAPPDPSFPVSEDIHDHVMHSEITICGSRLNMSDTQEKLAAGNMICLNVFFKSGDEVCQVFQRLKEGGKVVVELGPQFFSPMYGSIEDKFGLKWQLIS